MSPLIVLTPACAPGQGGGHVVRCLALAQALEAEGARCIFAVEPLGADLLGRLGWRGGVAASGADAIRSLQPEAVVVDDYRLDAAFEREMPGLVMAIDDLADRPHACALLLDSAHGRIEADYASWAPNARLLLGPDYALLRQGFAGPRREPANKVSRVFVCFGLSDVAAIAARAVQILRPLAPDAVFDVALAADAPSLQQLRPLTDDRLILHVDADVAPLIKAADLGVGAGGGMVWERRAAGLPQLVVALADNQRPMAERLAAEGVVATVDLNEPAFEKHLAAAFTRLLDPAARHAQLDNPNAHCDGLGAQRAAQALLEAIK